MILFVIILFFCNEILADQKIVYLEDLQIRKQLVNFMKEKYPDPEYIKSFDLSNLNSYRTYNTRCGKFYSIKAIDFKDLGASGYCGSAGCDNFFFKKTNNGLKLIFNNYLEKIEDRPLDFQSKDGYCLVLKVWVHGLQSKNLKRGGNDWLDGKIYFKNHKANLVLNDP